MSAEAHNVSRVAHLCDTVLATAAAETRRNLAYAIEIIRAPLFPVAYFGASYFAYDVAGKRSVDGVNAAGFLLIGMVGLLTWSASVWSSGYAIERERYEGTIGALFLTPASRGAVIAGYGLGGFVFLIPSLLVVVVLGFAFGAQLRVVDPLAVAAAGGALLVASLGAGFALAGLFVLSRRANLFANVVQHPIYLLGGFIVPRAQLPSWLRPVSDIVPFSHATDALRAAALSGAALGDVAGDVAVTLGLAALFAVAGMLLIGRVEHAAKRSGQLELF